MKDAHHKDIFNYWRNIHYYDQRLTQLVLKVMDTGLTFSARQPYLFVYVTTPGNQFRSLWTNVLSSLLARANTLCTSCEGWWWWWWELLLVFRHVHWPALGDLTGYVHHQHHQLRPLPVRMCCIPSKKASPPLPLAPHSLSLQSRSQRPPLTPSLPLNKPPT